MTSSPSSQTGEWVPWNERGRRLIELTNGCQRSEFPGFARVWWSCGTQLPFPPVIKLGIWHPRQRKRQLQESLRTTGQELEGNIKSVQNSRAFLNSSEGEWCGGAYNQHQNQNRDASRCITLKTVKQEKTVGNGSAEHWQKGRGLSSLTAPHWQTKLESPSPKRLACQYMTRKSCHVCTNHLPWHLINMVFDFFLMIEDLY